MSCVLHIFIPISKSMQCSEEHFVLAQFFCLYFDFSIVFWWSLFSTFSLTIEFNTITVDICGYFLLHMQWQNIGRAIGIAIAISLSILIPLKWNVFLRWKGNDVYRIAYTTNFNFHFAIRECALFLFFIAISFVVIFIRLQLSLCFFFSLLLLLVLSCSHPHLFQICINYYDAFTMVFRRVQPCLGVHNFTKQEWAYHTLAIQNIKYLSQCV